MSSPGSSGLSDYSSEDFPDEIKTRNRSLSLDEEESAAPRPSKRRRLIGTPPPVVDPYEGELVSSDTDGSVPASPSGHPGDDEPLDRQVTFCRWDGCSAGELGNMDNLVEHLHEVHIGTRQKKYACEWSDCTRKGQGHASGYALRAHMRSHTREKPFFCKLPECDRSFTRSDALAKHMRTVHEIEALRPSDPVPKHHSSHNGKFARLKLVFNKHMNTGDKAGSPPPASPSIGYTSSVHPEPEHLNNNVQYVADPTALNGSYRVAFPPDVHFTEAERALPADQLYSLLRRQQHWALQEGEELKAEIEATEKKRFEEWMKKELVLENVQEAELIKMMRNRQEMGITAEGLEGLWKVLKEDIAPGRRLEIKGKQPWWRTIALSDNGGELPDLAAGGQIKETTEQGA